MEYRRFQDTIFLRLDPEEEICERLLAVAVAEDIRLAQISGLGAVKAFTTGVFNTAEKKYYANDFSGPYEITSLTGTLTRMDGKPYLHVHMSAGDSEGRVVGGHLNRAVISATAEIVIRIADGEVDREFSEKVGLNLFRFRDGGRG